MSRVELLCTDGQPNVLQLTFCEKEWKNLKTASLYFSATEAPPVSAAEYPGAIVLNDNCLIGHVPVNTSTLPVHYQWYYVYTDSKETASTWQADSKQWTKTLTCTAPELPVVPVAPHRAGKWYSKTYPHEVYVALLVGLIIGTVLFCCIFSFVVTCVCIVRRKRRKRVQARDKIDYDRLTHNPNEREENEFLIRSPPHKLPKPQIPVKRASMTQNFLDKYYHPNLQKISEHEDDPIVPFDEVQF